MDRFKEAFGGLNKKQLEAVKAIDGPVLVIAGPGTGKTQLISTRVGYILRETDALPYNILCLTFTEAGVSAMRNRLSGLLGQEAYEVQISTYHAFGNELLRRNPEYVDEIEMQPLDELGAITLLQEQIRRLPYGNPLKFMDEHVRDILNFISDCKRALLAPEDVMAAAEANIRFISHMNKISKSALDKITSVSRASVPQFAALQLQLEAEMDKFSPPEGVLPLCSYAAAGLKDALDEFTRHNSTKGLTQWKNGWLAKDKVGNFIFAGIEANRKVLAAGELYGKYQSVLRRRRIYDYDDMILRAIKALTENPDFKYTLAEQYLYIMLDEFQDTNPAQMRLIELLTDHPVHEKRPNILAVGDDDQAIYAFQGADHGNMLGFAAHYDGVKIINLEENYRSHPDIIKTGKNIAAQIEQRLHHSFEGVRKNLVAAGKNSPKKAVLEAREFKSDAAQYSWVAEEITRLVSSEKLAAGDIAILAPKHRFLAPMLPFLARKKIPVKYEKRENILDVPAIRQLEQMSRLVVALDSGDYATADSLWPEILSYDFWGLTTEFLWQIGWKCRDAGGPWISTILNDKNTKNIALLFLRLKDLLTITTLEQQLDALMGVDEIASVLDLPMNSPFAGYYFGQGAENDPGAFISLLSNLSQLRSRLRDWRAGEDTPMSLFDFLAFVDAHRDAGLGIVDSSPYSEAESAVNITTAYGAKGKEYRAVFIICTQDNVWGSSSRNQGSRISLPANLRFIRYMGASEDERLRLLYVAATRAKSHLYFTGYSKTLSGRTSSRLKYLDAYERDGKVFSRILPKGRDEIKIDGSETLALEAVRDYWIDRHSPPFAPRLAHLLKPRLDKFQLSPSHINQFTDVSSGGPRNFFISSLLGFPPAPTPSAAYGNAVHEAIRWFLSNTVRQGKPPQLELILFRFESRLMASRLAENHFRQLKDRGRLSLSAWYKTRRLQPSENDKFEYSFRYDGVFLDDAHLSGKIDWLRINSQSKTAQVIDFKTGQAYQRWDSRVIKLHRYRQQLLMYKLLFEQSERFAGYKLNSVKLEFVEPDADGATASLELNYNEAEMQRLKALVKKIWQMIKNLDLPDSAKYAPSTAGIRAFENDLLNED